MPDDAGKLTPRQRFTAALQRRSPPGRVPHFELVFYLTMEAFGKTHPSQRHYKQWLQMTETERQLHRKDMAQLYIDTAERFEQDAINLHSRPNNLEEILRMIDLVRELSGDKYFLTLNADPTLSIPSGNTMEEISLRIADEPDKLDAELAARVDETVKFAEQLQRNGGLDGFTLCADYCFNTGPFLPLPWFDRFVLPHLKRVIQAQREMGFYTIKHTDGNIMPILDRLIEANPHAIHSLDPQGGVDMAEVVRLVGEKVALCGNVNCGLLTTGTDQECVESARYAITHGLKAPGYIFSTSNCIFTGMELSRYELILDVWRKEGIRT